MIKGVNKMYYNVLFQQHIWFILTSFSILKFVYIIFVIKSVVAQHYDTDVNKEYVIMGNSIVLKCQVPSFVADFVEVLSWHTDDNEDFFPGNNYG